MLTLFPSQDDPSAEICSVQKQKASLFASSLDVQYEQQAQLLTYASVMSDDSILLPEFGKLLYILRVEISKGFRLLFGLGSRHIWSFKNAEISFHHQLCTLNNGNYITSALSQSIDWAFPLTIENQFTEDNQLIAVID